MEKAEDDQDSDREEHVHEIVSIIISRLKKFPPARLFFNYLMWTNVIFRFNNYGNQ